MNQKTKRPNSGIPKKGSGKNFSKKLAELDGEVNKKLDEFQTVRDGRRCYPFFLYSTSIGDSVVEDVFDDLRKKYSNCDGQLDIIVFSSGGDIDAAYNLALLFRRFAAKDLVFIVPRWAKSAATLLVCSGDRILMSPIAELGPLDPQITEVNPMEQRVEHFSPLHIESTLDLIREEFKNGHKELAKGLLERLQFPLTLGSFKKSIDLGKEYLRRLLSTRMLKGGEKEGKASKIAEALTQGYPDHSFCIDIEEARTIGLEVEQLQGKPLDIAWDIHKLVREKEKVRAQQKRKDIEDLLKNMPQELRDVLPDALKETAPKQVSPSKIVLPEKE